MSDDGITWITVNGAHVPVKEGQDKGEAIREHFKKKLAEEPDNPETVRQQMKIKKAAGGKPRLTAEMATVGGKDAGDRSMRKAGRTKWNEDDYNAAAKEMNRLMDQVEGRQP